MLKKDQVASVTKGICIFLTKYKNQKYKEYRERVVNFLPIKVLSNKEYISMNISINFGV